MVERYLGSLLPESPDTVVDIEEIDCQVQGDVGGGPVRRQVAPNTTSDYAGPMGLPVATPVLGILGAGRVGTALARQALKAGYKVMIANSKGPATLALRTEILTPGALAASSTEVISRCDLLYLAMPLASYRALPRGGWNGSSLPV